MTTWASVCSTNRYASVLGYRDVNVLFRVSNDNKDTRVLQFLLVRTIDY